MRIYIYTCMCICVLEVQTYSLVWEVKSILKFIAALKLKTSNETIMSHQRCVVLLRKAIIIVKHAKMILLIIK